jgi:hypothetical protein
MPRLLVALVVVSALPVRPRVTRGELALLLLALLLLLVLAPPAYVVESEFAGEGHATPDTPATRLCGESAVRTSRLPLLLAALAAPRLSLLLCDTQWLLRAPADLSSPSSWCCCLPGLLCRRRC